MADNKTKHSPGTLALAAHLNCEPDSIPKVVSVGFYESGSHSLDKSVEPTHSIIRAIPRSRAEDMALDSGGVLRSPYGRYEPIKSDSL